MRKGKQIDKSTNTQISKPIELQNDNSLNVVKTCLTQENTRLSCTGNAFRTRWKRVWDTAKTRLKLSEKALKRD